MRNKNPYYFDVKLFKKNKLLKIKNNGKKCEMCGKFGNHVHHKDFSRNNHNIENLMVLCPQCHRQLHRRVWLCSYDSCVRPHYGLGLCLYHWNLFTLNKKSNDTFIFWGNTNESEIKDMCNFALSCLSTRERAIVTSRFYEDMTLKETGKYNNVTRERIRQIEIKALKKMRRMVRKEFLK